MRLMFLRLGCSLNLDRDTVATLQVEDRLLFSRIVSSLLSEKGQHAIEPYLLKNDEGKSISPRNGLHIFNSLPTPSALDRSLQTKLFRKVGLQIESESATYLRLVDLIGEVNMLIEEAANGLQGDYCLTKEWDVETYLKGYGFSLVPREEHSLLENCMHLFGLYADLEPDVPIVMVNAKSFFSAEELDELFEGAIFCGIQLLLLESWSDSQNHVLERKTVIDQHFLCEL